MKSFKHHCLTEASLSIGSITQHLDYSVNIADMIEKGEAFELVKGGTVKIKKDAKVIKAFRSHNNVPSKLMTTDGDEISLGSLLKSDRIKNKSGTGPKLSNKGDVAEGILATAIYMKFAGMSMNESTLNKILTSQVKLKTELKSKSKLDPSDEVILYINLATNHFKSLTNPDKEFVLLRSELVSSALAYAGSKNMNRYSNFFNTNKKKDVVKIVADGLGGQKSTKADLYVEWTAQHSLTGVETTRRLNLNISLKVGAVKQFGQVSGSKFENQEALWDTFGIALSGSRGSYNKLIGESKVVDALIVSYTAAYNNIKKAFAGKNEDLTPILTLFKAIKRHATLGENVELVQLDKGTFKKFKFNLSDLAMKELAKKHDFTADYRLSKGKKYDLPQVTINIDGIPFLKVRCKVDSNKETPYIRNLIEKEKGFAKLYKIK